MYLPRARAILAQCFEHSHWRLGLSGTRREREGGREGVREVQREKREGGAVRERWRIIFWCVFKNEKWMVCVMFNSGGSGQGSECVSFTSHLTHLPTFSPE